MLFRGPVKKTGNEWITNVLPLELVPILHREARGPGCMLRIGTPYPFAKTTNKEFSISFERFHSTTLT